MVTNMNDQTMRQAIAKAMRGAKPRKLKARQKLPTLHTPISELWSIAVHALQRVLARKVLP